MSLISILFQLIAFIVVRKGREGTTGTVRRGVYVMGLIHATTNQNNSIVTGGILSESTRKRKAKRQQTLSKKTWDSGRSGNPNHTPTPSFDNIPT